MERRSYFLVLCVMVAACTAAVGPLPEEPKEQHAMSARPTDITLVQWATNTNYAGGPQVGTPTKVAPAAGRFADGWRNNDVPPAQEQNYWQNQAGKWIDWFDNGSVAYAGIAAYASGQVDGTKIFSSGMGHYDFHTTPTFTADAFWAINGTGGQWVHELLAFVNLKKIPSIGPAPGESYTTATPAGRINKANIHHGWLNDTFGGPGTVTNTSIDAALGTGSLANYGGSHFVDVTGVFGHNLAVGDVVEFVIQAVGTCTQDFSVGTYVVENGGAAIPVTVSSGIPAYTATGGGRNVSVSIGFSWVVGTAGTFKIFVKGNVAAATTATLSFNSYMVRVTRP